MENEVKKPRKKMSRKFNKIFDRCIGRGCVCCSDMLGCNPGNPMYHKGKKPDYVSDPGEGWVDWNE